MHCVKSVRIRSYPGLHLECPYSAQMRENADQNNSEYGHFLHSDDLTFKCFLSIFLRKFALEKNDKTEQK